MSEANPLKRVAHKVTESLQGEGGGPADGIPGKPGAESPPVAEPTEPREPLPPKPDQSGPDTVSPTGQPTGADQARVAQSGAYLTNAQGTRLYDTDHSLKAGPRGPVLLQDHHLREKVMHFDHERIPERVVHARGAGAHGVFQSYGTAASVTKAGFLAADVETPVFTRFSTVVGSRGSSDTVRDTRGFATKFYTSEGVFDLVGNNIPVFFIQDAIKFPDVVHAAKPHPDREIPQAQSAHDTFWDFVSLHTEATHHTIFFMGDRGIPRSYRMMEGFGVHTFRLVNAAGETTLVKFHWKPKLGVHSLVWDEAQLINGVDPDFHRRDLADAIEAGAYPQWELGIQTFPDNPEQTFEGIDLLDPTNLVPEELAPVQPVGLLTLNRNPSNFFAETEQVAFHVGHLVPGIDITDDPLLAGRLFSYLDTQITRLGGPNFPQLPVNRPQAPVNDMLRDGMHQTAVHRGVAPYRPNSLDGGAGVVRGPLQPAAAVLAEHELGGARAHHRRVHLRAGQVLRAGRPRADPPGPGQHRPRTVRGRRRGSRAARPAADGAAGRRRAQPGALPGRPHLAHRRQGDRHRDGRRRPGGRERRTAGGAERGDGAAGGGADRRHPGLG
jgi:catalase